jgi:hypothetical protein
MMLSSHVNRAFLVPCCQTGASAAVVEFLIEMN